MAAGVHLATALSIVMMNVLVSTYQPQGTDSCSQYHLYQYFPQCMLSSGQQLFLIINHRLVRPGFLISHGCRDRLRAVRLLGTGCRRCMLQNIIGESIQAIAAIS
jgi:hypothetical protein